MAINIDTRQRPLAPEPRRNRVLTLAQWADLNSLSYASAKRLIASGQGPKLIKLSERRIGVREDHNEQWQNSRICNGRY
jgi:predicted DNA-binding transcriptional regulator AlpA